MTGAEFTAALDRHHISTSFAAWLFDSRDSTVSKWKADGIKTGAIPAFLALLDASGDEGRRYLFRKRLEKHHGQKAA